MFQFFGIEFTPIRIAGVIAIIVIAAFILKKFVLSKQSEYFKPEQQSEQNFQDQGYDESTESEVDDIEDFDDDLGSEISSNNEQYENEQGAVTEEAFQSQQTGNYDPRT